MTGDRNPDFVGIGAQKAGTTWLFEALRMHPEVVFPSGKEIHFWDWYPDRGLNWYRARFRSAPATCKVGEITPAYAVLPAASIAAMRRAMPEVRLFYILRNPIERAWSAALMTLRWALMFEHEASDAWFADVFRSSASVLRGDYEHCLRAWRDHFPEDQIQVLFLDDLAADPRGVLAGVCTHIGVDPAAAGRMTPEKLGAPVNAGTREPIRPSLRPVLEEIYAERIRSLARYLGRDLSSWLEG